MEAIAPLLGLGSILVILAGLFALVRPVEMLRIRTRTTASLVLGAGIAGLLVASGATPDEAAAARVDLAAASPSPTTTSVSIAIPTTTSTLASTTTSTTTSTTPSTSTTTTRPPPTTTTTSPREAVTVTGIVDGDTIDVAFADRTDRVRLIGIDAPDRGDPGFEEAAAYLSGLIAGSEISMVRDHSDRDRFDRLLRYLYIGDVFVNEAMVTSGWAQAARYPPDTAMADVLEAAQDEARTSRLGAWAPPPTTTVTVATTTTVASTTTSGGGNCDSSYPDVCIPPYPPDLDCGEISFRQFKVTGSDPHGFDGDHDGIGCES
jgi:micrococcal nuclease